MRSIRSYHQAEQWSWHRARLHGSDVTAWFRTEGWTAQDVDRIERHAFIDGMTSPAATVRRIWHTPIRLVRAESSASVPQRAPATVWMQVDGNLSISASGGKPAPLPAGSAFFHTRPPAAFSSTGVTARYEVSLPGRRETALARIIAQSGSPTWSALAGVINAVLNAPEAPDTRTLALYAQSIETLAEALWLETVPMSAVVESDTFTRALELITAHASDPTFTIEVLAQMLGVTRSHVTRLFRERGAMPSRTLKRERVHRARTMLAIDPQIPLEDVARSCGFSSPRLLRESLRPHRARRPDADPLRIP